MRGAIYTAVPLMLISLVLYNVLVLFGANMDHQLVTFGMRSGDWTLRLGDLLVIVSLVFLFGELVKSTTTGANSVVNHALSMVIFIVFLVQFVLMEGFANSTFFIIMCMQLLDVVAGFTISIVAAKRDFGNASPVIGPN